MCEGVRRRRVSLTVDGFRCQTFEYAVDVPGIDRGVPQEHALHDLSDSFARIVNGGRAQASVCRLKLLRSTCLGHEREMRSSWRGARRMRDWVRTHPAVAGVGLIRRSLATASFVWARPWRLQPEMTDRPSPVRPGRASCHSHTLVAN
jgi:hypothetical protein